MNHLISKISCQSLDATESGLLQLLLDALPSHVLLLDAEGNVIAANGQAERFLGWTAETLQEQPIHDLLQCRLDARGEPPAVCPIMQALDGSGGDGSRLWVRCRGEAFKPIEYRCSPFPTGRGSGTILTFNDLTRQLDIERDLRSLASIAEASPIAIAALNDDANLIHANPAMMALIDRFGFSTDVRPVVLPGNVEALIQECVDRQVQLGPVETRVGDHCFEWKFVPVAGERIVRGYGIDLTARKRIELELLDAKIAAEAGNIAKSEFLANISHEIRTPLNGIVGMAELLSEGAREPEHLDEYAKTIRSCADALVIVIEEILEMAAVETGKATVQKAPFNLDEFISHTTVPWRQRANEKGLNFKITIADGAPKSVVGDRQRLKQVLGRLIGNAIKFTEQGQVEIVVEPRTASASSAGATATAVDTDWESLVFSIRDSGIGISADKQRTIFDRFSQADASNARRYGGTGLGLAISKQLVEMMGGAISVESEPGKGTHVWFSLPTGDPRAPSQCEVISPAAS